MSVLFAIPQAPLGAEISKIAGYKPYFRTAFGSDEITGERIAKAIVAYEQTRMSGNSVSLAIRPR